MHPCVLYMRCTASGLDTMSFANQMKLICCAALVELLGDIAKSLYTSE